MSIVINSIEYTNLLSIQNGQEGTVYFAQQKSEEVVIKQLPLQEREINIIENLMSKPPNNFVRILDFDRKSYIVMEKGNGTLTEFLQRQDFKQLKLLQKIKLFEQIVNGTCEIHSRKMIHRDLKPDTLQEFTLQFKFEDNYDVVKIILKLIDTGQMDQLNDKVQLLSDFVGTENYRAPEYYQKNIEYNQKVDIWSLGLIFYQMITDCCLIQKKRQILDSQYIISKIESINISNENIQELFYKMLDQCHNLRQSAKQLKIELQRIIENIELKEELQRLRNLFEVQENKFIVLANSNESLQNQVYNQTQKIVLLDQKLQEYIQKYNNQSEKLQKNETQIQIIQEMNSNFKYQISQLEQSNQQLKFEQEKYKSEIVILLEEKARSSDQNLIKQIHNKQEQFDQLIKSNQIIFKPKKILLFGLPGAGKTWIFSKLEGQNKKYINESTTKFQEYFINDQNITIVDSPAFLDQLGYDEREGTYKNYNSYFQQNQIDDIVLVVQYQRTDLMKQQIKHCFKLFQAISGVIVTKFIDTEIIPQNEKEQLKNSLKFCNSSIYFTNKDDSQTDLLNIFYKIRMSNLQAQINYKDIFKNYIN